MKNRNFLFILVILLFILSLNFVFSIHTTSPPSFSVNVSQNYSIFNITLNNTNIGQDGNITEINITLPSAISFVLDSNGTNSLADFSNTSTVLTWKNSSYFMINGSTNNANFWFNATILPNPRSYNITVTSQNGTGAYSTNISITIIDSVAPVIGLISPENASSNTSTSWTFYFNVSDSDPLTNCSLVLDSTKADSNSSLNITGGSNLFAKDISTVGNHTWSINCTDLSGNNNQTETRTFTITQESGDSDDNGGGNIVTEIFWTLTQTLTLQQFNDGFTRELGGRNRLKFTINATEHYVGVISLTNTTATMNVSSNPQQAVFEIGEEKRFEVTDDNYYDILVTLNNIINSKANVTVISIHEKIDYTTSQTTTPQTTNTNQTNNETTSQTTTPQTTSSEKIIAAGESLLKSTWFWVLISLIIIIAGIVIFSLFLKKRYYNKGYRKKWD